MNDGLDKQFKYLDYTHYYNSQNCLDEFAMIYKAIHHETAQPISIIDDDIDLKKLGAISFEYLDDTEADKIEEGKYYAYYRVNLEDGNTLIICIPWLDAEQNLAFQFDPKLVSRKVVGDFILAFLKMKIDNLIQYQSGLSVELYDRMIKLYYLIEAAQSNSLGETLPPAN